MKNVLCILAFTALLLAGCKSGNWVWQQKEDPIIAANNAPETDPEPEPEREPEPQAPKEIIFVLGIDGMD